MKKTIILIAGLLTLAFLATGCLSQTDTQEEFTAITTQEQLDTEIVVKAVKKKNIELCETIENQEQKNDCITRVNDQILLDQAEEEINIGLCEEISRSNTIEQCKIFVQELIDKEKAEEEMRKAEEEMNNQRKIDLDYMNSIEDKDLTLEHCENVVDEELKEACETSVELLGQI